MQYISTLEASQNLSAIIAQAQREPVMVGDALSPEVVLLSAEQFKDYQHYQNLRRLDASAQRASAYAQSQGLTSELLHSLLGDISACDS